VCCLCEEHTQCSWQQHALRVRALHTQQGCPHLARKVRWTEYDARIARLAIAHLSHQKSKQCLFYHLVKGIFHASLSKPGSMCLNPLLIQYAHILAGLLLSATSNDSLHIPCCVLMRRSCSWRATLSGCRAQEEDLPAWAPPLLLPSSR